jgi:hypothetical protein
VVQVEKAKETEAKIDEELKDLQATLSNIEGARPFEDLTVSLPSSLHRLVKLNAPLLGRRRWPCPPSHRRGRRDNGLQGQVHRTGLVSSLH